MNLLKLRSQARLKSSVSVNDFSNANLDEQLNVAYYTLADIMAQLGGDYFEEQNTKFNLVANSALYSLPTDCMQLKGVRLAYSSPSTNSDYRVARHYDPSQVHNVSSDEEGGISTNFPIYDVTNNYVRIKPTPSSAVTNGGKLWYIARPSALTLTGDSPIIPTQYHDLLSVYGAKEMAFKNAKWEKWKRLKAEWNEGIELLRETLSDRDLGEVMRFRGPHESLIPSSQRRELPED